MYPGKIKKYDVYLTSYEQLISIPNFEQYLKPGVSASSLRAVALKQSDNESAQKMQINRQNYSKTSPYDIFKGLSARPCLAEKPYGELFVINPI